MERSRIHNDESNDDQRTEVTRLLSGGDNEESVNNLDAPSPKKRKTTPASRPTKVFTFGLSHSPVQVQLLDTDTIYDLVEIMCEETTIGECEGIYDHAWDVCMPKLEEHINEDELLDMEDFGLALEGRKDRKKVHAHQKLGDIGLMFQMTLKLAYDYGSTSYYEMTVVHMEDLAEEESIAAYPRAKPISAPAKYQVFQPSMNSEKFNALFPVLDECMQHSRTAIYLFQPGRCKVHGFIDFDQSAKMIYLPIKSTGTDLSDYFHVLEVASRRKRSEKYCWFSIVAFPSNYHNDFGVYGKHLERGFCEALRAPATPSSYPKLNDMFPNVATLAGYDGKKRKKRDSKVPNKGWITYKNKILTLCSGTPKKPPPNKAPPGTAFHGNGKHEPQSPRDILAQYKFDNEIQSIYQLLCTAEGLLRAL